VLRDKAKMAEWNSKNAPLSFTWAFPKQTVNRWKMCVDQGWAIKLARGPLRESHVQRSIPSNMIEK